MRTIIISDLHAPFICRKSIKKVIRYVEKTKPDNLVINGDLYDMLCFSAHRKPIRMTPVEELTKARNQIAALIKVIREVSIKTVIYITLGNHDARLFKRVMDKMPEVECLLNTDIFHFDGVKTVMKNYSLVDFGGFVVTHGVSTRVGYHRDKMVRSVAVGHSHVGGVSFRSVANKCIWELNSGCLCDYDNEEAFGYTPLREKNWTKGIGEVVDGIPRFIPVECL